MQEVLDFLRALEQNNNREWYHAHKDWFKKAYGQFELFVNMVIAELGRDDPSIAGIAADKTIFRLFRDTRFNQNRPPLKINFGAAIAEGGRKSIMPSYYIHLQPGASFLGGGIYCPQGSLLKAIRTYMLEHGEEMQHVVEATNFKQYFNGIQGEKLKTQPRGFPREHPNIDWARYKSYIVMHGITDEMVTDDDFFNYTLRVFRSMKPFNDILRRAVNGA